MVTTAQFLKTCAKVPKVMTKDEDPQYGVDNNEVEGLLEKQ